MLVFTILAGFRARTEPAHNRNFFKKNFTATQAVDNTQFCFNFQGKKGIEGEQGGQTRGEWGGQFGFILSLSV